MAFKYGFFNSEDGDRRYNADDLSGFFFGVLTNGVLIEPPTSLMVTAAENLTVTVLPGRAVVKGKYFVNTSDFRLTLQQASELNPRFDRVVLRLDLENRCFQVAAKQGNPASSPNPPALTRSGSIYEISLARILVGQSVSVISASAITDERPDKTVCGAASLTAGEMAFLAIAGQTAVVTHSEPTGTGGLVVDVRCDAIADVTPPPAAWAVGSVAWDIAAGDLYGLQSSRVWQKIT